MIHNKIAFYKFHGAGNDFIMINLFGCKINLKASDIAHLCDRHLGIGADGLITIEPFQDVDFRMIYYNSDGFEGSMCGNGGRSAAAFAFFEKITGAKSEFLAFDGVHQSFVKQTDEQLFDVEITMKNVENWELADQSLIVNTGSPHYVLKTDKLSDFDVYSNGKRIRYDERFGPKGINVNFMELIGDQIHLRTYERGVENETLSCGTGVTAAAIAASLWYKKDEVCITTKGGVLKVSLTKSKHGFTDIVLKGPVEMVFKGEIDLK